MKLVEGMKDEKLGVALLYNFTKGYGEVPMHMYNVVLPLLFHDTFREQLTKEEPLSICIKESMQKKPGFTKEMQQQIAALEDMTSKALGIALLHKHLDFQIVEGTMHGRCKESTILPLNEAILLGQYLQGKTVEDIIDMLQEEGEHIVILDADTLGQDMDLSNLRGFGKVTIIADVEQEAIAATIQEATIVITNKKWLGEQELQQATKVKLICVTATGFNNIDVAYCKEQGITVCNVKGYSTNSVAQHTFALLLDIYHKNRYYHEYVASGAYSKSPMFSHFEETFYELEGKTWGIVGMGDIGQKVAQIASVFGCQVQYYSTSGKNKDQPYPCVDFNTLLTTSDIISIHAPLNAQTNDLFNQEAFAKMKPTAYIINVGRGAIINEQALAEALQTRRIAGAGLDVFSKEPVAATNPLLRIDANRLRMTPHIAWATKEARNRVIHEIYANIEAFLAGKPRNVC